MTGDDVGRTGQVGAETEVGTGNEFFNVTRGFDTSQLTDEDGAAIVVHRGRSARSQIVACGVIRTTDDQAQVGQAEGVTPLADVATDPDRFTGQDVTVEDQVGRRFGRGGFTIGEGDNEVLVLSTSERGFGPDVVRPGTRLRVTGEPRTFNAEQFEEEFGVSLNRRISDEFEGRSVITARPGDVGAAGTDDAEGLLGDDDEQGLTGDDGEGLTGDDNEGLVGDDEEGLTGDDNEGLLGDDDEQGLTGQDDEEGLTGDNEEGLTGDDDEGLTD
ncbi:MAG: hypothetical protein M3220_05335 [Chloroflexota bacterium]|nr:hypothetical protein [Chloroflexota bacterium]